MKPGDLVAGRTSSHLLCASIDPILGMIGLVLDINPTTRTARILHNDQVYMYFMSELQVICDAESGPEFTRPIG